MKGSMIIGVALASALALATGEFAHADTPYEINVLISTTGPAAFLGKEEAQDLQFIEQLTNQSGGIKGRPLKFVMLDDESNPQTAVQLTNQIIAKNVPAFLGPVLTSPCNAVMPIVAKSGPVDYCLSPGIDPDPRSYVFSAGVSSNGLRAVMVRYFRLRNWKRIAIITSTDATGQSLDRAFKRAKELPENKDVTYVDWEHFNLTDITVAAQIQRIKAANPQVLIAWTSGTAFVTLLRGIRDAGLDIPVGGGNANMIYAQMAQTSRSRRRNSISMAFRHWSKAPRVRDRSRKRRSHTLPPSKLLACAPMPPTPSHGTESRSSSIPYGTWAPAQQLSRCMIT